MIQPRDAVFDHFGWYFRVYYGSTTRQQRMFTTRVNGLRGVSHGVTLRLRGDKCVGMQIRKNAKEGR
jgi:hypothetical protein